MECWLTFSNRSRRTEVSGPGVLAARCLIRCFLFFKKLSSIFQVLQEELLAHTELPTVSCPKRLTETGRITKMPPNMHHLAVLTITNGSRPFKPAKYFGTSSARFRSLAFSKHTQSESLCSFHVNCEINLLLLYVIFA